MPTTAELILWHDSIKKISRINDYQKTKKLLDSIKEQLKELGQENVAPKFKPTNPRQEAEILHNKIKRTALEKQRNRLEKQISLLEQQIKRDMAET
jgi:predicted nuclease with TOPRIM domain